MAKNTSIIQARYDKAHCRTYGLKLNLETDSDIIAKLATVDSMQGYIKQLIREDIARAYSVPKNTKKEGIIMKRTYGNTKTHLVLTGKAAEFYHITDPISIVETESDGQYLYQVYSGNELMHNNGMMTEQQLIKWLEDGYDEYMSCQ